MRVLVTGAAGFIGSSIAARLLRDGHEVVGADALREYYDVRLKRASLARLEGERFTFRAVDLATADLDELLDGVDLVFHEAGQPGVRSSWGTEFDVHVRDNIVATQRLLEAARRSSTLRRFVSASSSSVYGTADRYPCRETDVPRPASPYGVSKLAAEQLCTLYGRNFDLPTVSLRYFSVYGPRQRPDMAFTRFIGRALAGRPIPILGDGTQIRDFTFVDDVVEANLAAAAADLEGGEVLNVAAGASVDLNATLDILEGIIGHPIRRDHSDRVPGDVLRTGGSSERAHELIGWVPRVTLEAGLQQQVAWFTAEGIDHAGELDLPDAA